MASEAIYKNGQGYWTRMVSAAAFGLLLAYGTFWIWSKAGAGASMGQKYVAGAIALAFLGGLGGLGGLASDDFNLRSHIRTDRR